MSMMVYTQRALQLFTGIGLLALSSCSSKNSIAPDANSDSAIIVTVATPSLNELTAINVSGQVEASQSADISTRVMGYITKLSVKVGDHVNKGQVIATISN